MELRNDPRLYSAGAVAFDSSPSVNVYAQLMAKKQAKDEAIDEYYRKLPSTLNSAGMRDQDRAGFDQAVAEWQKHWIQNKNKIRKGNSQEAFDAEQKFRSLQEAIQRSKDAAKTDLELGKMRFSKENSYIFDDDDFVNSQHQHSLPIWDARHKPMDLATVALPPRPFEAKDQDEYYKSIVSGMEAGKKYDYSKSYTNPQTGQVIVPTIDVLNDDQIKKAAERAMELVATDKSKKKFFEKGLNTGRKEDWDVLQNAYSKYFKGEVDSPEKAAAADAIIKLSIPKKYAEEQEINYQQKQKDKQINITLNQGNKGGASGSNISDYDVLETYKPKALNIRDVKGGGIDNFDVVLAKDVDVKDQQLIEVQPIREGSLIYYKVRPNGDWEGKGGQVISWAKVAQANMDKTTANEEKRGRTILTADKTKQPGGGRPPLSAFDKSKK